MATIDPGSRSPRMRDVAERAGVSLGTVSHALNHPDRVTEQTRSRVLAAIAELGFVPDRRARGLAAGRSRTIGFVVVDLSNSFFLDMARGAEAVAEEHGLTVLLANSDMSARKERASMTVFEEERVAGILLAPLPTPGDAVAAVERWTREVVVLNADAGAQACSVRVDNELGGYLAARHLIECGRRALAFAGGSDTLLPVRERQAGVQRAVAETNGAVRLEMLPSEEVRTEDGRGVAARLLDRDRAAMPDAVVAASDLLALGMLQTLLAGSALRVPDDLALVGYDNNRAAWESVVALSTIAQPGEAMGASAMRLLIEELEDPGSHTHSQHVLAPDLLVRESSRRVG